jgi:uncharacterized protein
VLGGLGALLVLALVEGGIVAAVDGNTDDLSIAATLTIQALLAITLAGVAFAVARPGPGLAAPADLGLRRPLSPAMRASVLGYLTYIGCALVIAALIQPEQEDITRDLGADEGVLGSLAAGILIVVAAPLTEEIFFRGFVFGGLRRALPFAAAAAIPAVIWGLLHYTGPDSWGVVLQLAIFGLVLAWLYERTGSLWPPIALHLFNNALAFAILMSS